MRQRILLALVVLLLGSGALHIYLLDGLDGWLWSGGFVDDTEYSPGYTDRAFRRVRWSSMSEDQVHGLLGEPFGEVWLFGDHRKLLLADGAVEHTYGTWRRSTEPPRGTPRALAQVLAGVPTEKRWVYSRSGSGESYRVRIVGFRADHVWETINEFYLD